MRANAGLEVLRSAARGRLAGVDGWLMAETRSVLKWIVKEGRGRARGERWILPDKKGPKPLCSILVRQHKCKHWFWCIAGSDVQF